MESSFSIINFNVSKTIKIIPKIKFFILLLILLASVLAFIPRAHANPFNLTNPMYFKTAVSGAYIYFPSSVLPQNFNDWYFDGQKNYFNSTISLTTTKTMTITAWFTNNWLNYTVAPSGIQQISNGTKPAEIFFNNITYEEGNGWSYSGTTITINGATNQVSVSWVQRSQYVPPPPGGSQNSGGSSNIEVTFQITDKGNPVQDARLTLYILPYNLYYGTYWSDDEGKIVQSLETGEYRYTADYLTLSTNGTFWHDGYDTVYIEFEPSQASHAPLSVNLLVIIIAVLAIFAIIKVRKG